MWQVILPWLAPMLALILVSAFFSGSEAALFSLRTRDRRALARGPLGGRVAVRLLNDPETLLSTVLFWNLLVNMTYFAIASIVGAKLESLGTAQVAAFTILSLVSIIFFSEMLPKSIAVLSPMRFARLAGPPLAIAVKVLTPILPLVRISNTVARRLIWPSFKPERDLEVADIERAIELGTGDAALAARERAALRQLVQLATTRVDEWMVPRSFLQLHRGPITPQAIAGGTSPSGYVMIAEPESDEIVGSIAVRRLRPSQMDDLAACVESVIFVPWSANVATAFDALEAAERQVAGVVNEYGETVGVLTLEMILEGILRLHPGRPPESGAQAHFEQLAEGVWRVSGMMSVRRLAEYLGATPPEGRSVTVAGMMQEANERFPRPGDTCQWEGFDFQVVEAGETQTDSRGDEETSAGGRAVERRRQVLIEVRQHVVEEGGS
ncbi:CNNM domain-containing protein [Planctomycetaceae bacterium SH139]